MRYQALAGGIFFLTAVCATPTPTNPKSNSVSKARSLAKRADPSPYPGEGGPCKNEPSYLNFDINIQSDKDKAEAIHYAFCTEFNVHMIAGEKATNAVDRTIFARFFEDDDESKDEVNQIWNKLFDFGTGEPKDLVSTFIFDNVDFLKLCDGDDVESLAYTGEDEEGDDLSKTHFCDISFRYPHLDAIACDTLDQYPSGKMEHLGRIMVHEFLHYETVGVLGRIVDSNNADEIAAYYPSRAHGLLTQDDQPGLCVINADNFAWLSTNAHFKDACPNGPNSGNFNDPPPYKADEPGDPDNDGIAVPPPPSPLYNPGWCGAHIVQYQKNQPFLPNLNGPEYLFDVCIYDAKQILINAMPGGGCSRVIAPQGQGQPMTSLLPWHLVVTTGAVDEDPIRFDYSDQHWTSDHDAVHFSLFGGYKDGKREGDTGFAC